MEIQLAVNVSARDVPADNQCNGNIPLSNAKPFNTLLYWL